MNRRPNSATYINRQRQSNKSELRSGLLIPKEKRLQTELDNSNIIINSRRKLLKSQQKSFLNREELSHRFINVQKIHKSKQSLYDQNIKLRNQIKELRQQVQIYKTKYEIIKRKNSKYTKKLEMQFEKQLYWTGNKNYIVQGVKQQYQKIKQMLQRKNLELEDIKKIIAYTDVQQIKIERDQYKNEVNRLYQQLLKLKKHYRLTPQQDQSQSHYDKSVVKEMIQKKEEIINTINEYEEGLQIKQQIITGMQQKIDFLQKIIIEKQNKQHNLNSLNRKLNNEIDALVKKNKSLQSTIETINSKYFDKISEIKVSENRRFQSEVKIFEQQVKSMKEYIAKLQKQVGYLSTLLSYWKPLQDQDLLKNINDTRSDKKNTLTHQKQSSRDLNKLSFSSKINTVKESLRIHKRFGSGDSLLNQSIGKAQSLKKQDVKSTKNEKSQIKNYYLKRYRVNKQDLKEVCEEIKYRLLKADINISQARQLFQTDSDEISIKQINQILKLAPFNLQSEDNRILFSRYLIEDPNDAVIYYDENIVNDCHIVKSIFVQLIPNFQILTKEQRDKTQTMLFEYLKKYHKVLTQIISQYNNKLIISKKKLQEILIQQEIKQGQNFIDLFIMLLLDVSSDLNNLDFKKFIQNIIPAEDRIVVGVVHNSVIPTTSNK